MKIGGQGQAGSLRFDHFRSLSARFRQSGMLRAVGVLVGGTASAHAITALAMPIVTRLYSPQEMSLLAVFASLLAILYVSICLRFDIALPLPERDEDAANLLAAGALSAAALSAGLMILVLTLPAAVYQRLGYGGFEPYAWLLPPATFIAGLYSLSQFWFVRRRSFGLIAHSRIGQSAASAATQVGLGAFHYGPIGLIAGHILNSGAGSVLLGARLLRRDKALLSGITWSGIRRVCREYRRFPQYSAAEALANTAGIQLPVVLIAAMAAGPEAGYLTLALYVMQAPMSLIGTAVSQVYLSDAPHRYRAGSLGSFTAEVLVGLLRAGVGPLLFIGIVSPFAFGYVFGAEWSRAGVLVAWMTPWFVMQFLAVPVSMALHVTGSQRTALVLQIAGFAWRVGAVWLAGAVASRWISETYALTGALFYAAYLLVVVRRVNMRMWDLLVFGRKAAASLALWILLGVLFAASFRLFG